METQEKKIVSRGEFLRSLGVSSSALMAFYCMGTLTACSSKDDDPTPGGNTGGNNTNAVTGTTTGSNIDFTIDLTAYKEKNLKTEGEFAVIGDAIVIALSNQKYVALSKKMYPRRFHRRLPQKPRATSAAPTTARSSSWTARCRWARQLRHSPFSKPP